MTVCYLLPARVLATVVEIKGRIVDVARSYLKTTNWAPRPQIGPLEKAFYCNVFVADVCEEADAATWVPIAGTLGKLNPRPPLAGEWENPGFAIRGWQVIYHPSSSHAKNAAEIFALRSPGDVIAGGGHVGIMSDDRTSSAPKVYSASAITGAVEASDWSFRLPPQSNFSSGAAYDAATIASAKRFTVRRFVGLS